MQYSKAFFLIVLVSVVLLFIKLGSITVFQIAEARNSQVPAEMLDRHDYTVPYFNGELRTDKPPLHYYAILFSYYVGGVNETSARFFSALCGMLVIIATWLFANRYAGPGVAWWSSLVLLASVHTIFQFRLATPDPYLIACHVLSLFCFWEGYQKQRKLFLWLMYFLWGLAILAKGPVGIILPAITILLYLLFRKEWSIKTFLKLQPVWGIVIVAIIALPWFYLVHTETNGTWTQGFFIQHNFDRFREPLDGHKGPFVLPLLFVLMGLFPFSIFMIRAIWFAWKQRNQDNWLFFNLLAAAVIGFTYSVSATKLLNYTTPAYPFLAIIIGAFIFNHINGKIAIKKLWPEWIVLAALSIALTPGIYFWMQSEKALNNIAVLSIPLLIFPATVLWGIYYYKKLSINKAFSIVALGAIIANAFFFSVLFPALDAEGSVHQIKQLIGPGRPVIAYRFFNEAFTYYHKQRIVVMNSAEAVAGFLKNNPSALVLERASQPHLMDSLKGLVIKAGVKDLFSNQYSFVYELKSWQVTHEIFEKKMPVSLQ